MSEKIVNFHSVRNIVSDFLEKDKENTLKRAVKRELRILE